MSEKVPRGKIIDSKADEIPIGMFAIIRSENSEDLGDGRMKMGEIEQLTSGDSSLGSSLLGVGVMKSETEKGHDVFVMTNPADELVMPDNLLMEDGDGE